MNLFFRPVVMAAAAWLLVASYLFFLPGSKLPQQGWMDQLHLDKWVHIGIFFLLCWLWRRALRLNSQQHRWGLVLAAITYGCLVEWVQHNFIAFRSFDLWDVVADAAGALAGAWFGLGIKNKPL